jgi:hypothetical protein
MTAEGDREVGLAHLWKGLGIARPHIDLRADHHPVELVAADLPVRGNALGQRRGGDGADQEDAGRPQGRRERPGCVSCAPPRRLDPAG